ncbi:two-component system response regulator [Novosphingobium sediminicola]|uniref:Diguanylate cyclase (GGDEF)-like protein/PAS domain S-box-containing protein n=1 Tax=Novosphingobium sediminicola TaxID=563162 RepID=A0A7W6G6F1_9SPHN|nr:EAL domain-containing protein [Novosphingobium sediminicola]MBB3955241.1 diguanylate cyclase (GGDEF)-like protein/PAS domain S-box-containing protein [Novosphingobium sediminicola]
MNDMSGAFVADAGAVVQTILVVDDNPVNLGVVGEHLEDNDYNVTVAQDGMEGLRRAELGQPDLILLDVMMPGIDGFETCRRLKANPATCDIPVIFMTALTDVTDKMSAFQAGGVDYISKPFQTEELLARVRTHLALREAQRQMARKNALLQSEIRARHEAEISRQQSEQSYRRLFETAHDGLLLLDAASGRVIDANPALVAMLGHDRDAILGRLFWELPCFAEIPAARAAVEDLSRRETVKYDDWELQKTTGAPLHVEVIGRRYRNEHQTVIQYNIRDTSDRKEAEARIRYMALHDALTGLPNRTLLTDRLGHAVAQARRCGQKVAVMMLDLDHFKHINDSLGHHVGDMLLQTVADRLRACLRECDTAARLGGDEFVILLGDVDNANDVDVVAAKVLHALKSSFMIEQHQLHIGGSIGVSTFPQDGEDPGKLLRAADTAMYDAKGSGRGIHRHFTSAMNEATMRWQELANDIHQACVNEEFTLHYQPQIALDGYYITGVEALLRWNHPVQGLVLPSVFVPLLEELGLIVEVGEWALVQACRQNVAWQQAGHPPIRMAVNLSAQQFYRGDIVKSVKRALEVSGMDPQWLELELTESLTLDDTEVTIQIMNDLKALGVTLSLDDFGTGWSSLSYLRRFPLDRIKIDRTFMSEVATEPNAAAVVQGILSLAQNLGLGCVAEGVESREQLDYLKRQICSEMQGFLFSRPLAPDDVASVLTHAMGPRFIEEGWPGQD